MLIFNKKNASSRSTVLRFLMILAVIPKEVLDGNFKPNRLFFELSFNLLKSNDDLDFSSIHSFPAAWRSA